MMSVTKRHLKRFVLFLTWSGFWIILYAGNPYDLSLHKQFSKGNLTNKWLSKKDSSTVIQREVRYDENITDGDLDIAKEMSVYCRGRVAVSHANFSMNMCDHLHLNLTSQVFSNCCISTGRETLKLESLKRWTPILDWEIHSAGVLLSSCPSNFFNKCGQEWEFCGFGWIKTWRSHPCLFTQKASSLTCNRWQQSLCWLTFTHQVFR